MTFALALAAALAAPASAPAAPPDAAAGTPRPSPPPADDEGLFPAIEPFREGMLNVSDLHTFRWETSGNPKGRRVFVLHGGPGADASPRMRRLFDPARWLVVQHDQRGSRRSTPHAELREITTAALVEDVEKLRTHLGIEKMVLVGGSWGTTLAIAYAEKHPDRVEALVHGGDARARRAGATGDVADGGGGGGSIEDIRRARRSRGAGGVPARSARLLLSVSVRTTQEV